MRIFSWQGVIEDVPVLYRQLELDAHPQIVMAIMERGTVIVLKNEGSKTIASARPGDHIWIDSSGDPRSYSRVIHLKDDGIIKGDQA